jgi:hypothetical protein
MNSTPPLAKDWATVGRVIYSASSAEEKEVANDLLDSLFEGNTEERDNFVLGNVNFKPTQKNTR